MAGGGTGGDGGQATAAQLNSPSLVFADAFGNLYIGDSSVTITSNTGATVAGASAIRRVDAKTGIITTIAGQPGTMGYTGDGGLATAAQIDADALFVDNTGNLYFTDVFDEVVRRVNAQTGVINTIAGNGATCFQLPCGDGGPALSAEFQALNGVVADSAGNVYVGDAGTNVVRKISAATGTIDTVNGTPLLASQVGNIKSATLAAIDSAGNLFLNNLVSVYQEIQGQITEVNPQSQTSRIVAGLGGTCLVANRCGDGNVATNALLSGVNAILGGIVGIDSQDNLYIGDSGNQVVRKITGPTSSVNFGAVVLGSPASQAFTLTNNGSTPLVLGTLNVEGDFVQQLGTGSATGPADCLPNTTLATGASCLAEMAFTPIQSGAATGTLTITSNSVNATNGANVIDLAGTGQGLGGKAAQTIAFGALQNTAYGATLELSATASSELPVSFLVNGPATLTTTAQATFLKTTGAGTVAVTAYQIGDQTTYKAATPVVQSFTVTPVALTVAAGPQSIALGSAIPDLSRDFTVAGLINGDTTGGLPALSTTATASSPCGTYPIHITQGSLTFSSGYAANFVDSSLSITGTAQTGAQAQTISFSQSLSQVNYGATPITLTASASSGLPVSFTATGAAKVSGSTLTITGAGPVSVTANQYGSCQYLAAQPVTQTFNVAPAALTVTADSKTVALGTALPTLTYTITGFVNSDPPTVASGAPVLSTTATSDSPSGNYPISVAAGTLAAANYTFSLVPGTLTINPGTPQTISFGPIASVTYGAGPISLGATASSGLPVTYSVSSGSGAQTAAVVGNQLTILGAGTVTVTASQAGGGSYAPATSVTQTFTVAPAVLTVTASDATRVDYTQNPAFAYTIVGFVNSDPAQVVSGTPTLTTTATPSSAPGNYPSSRPKAAWRR